MRKYSNLLMSGCVLFAVALTISSCNDDDPPAKPKLSFEADKTVKESDGDIEVKVILDKPAKDDVTLTYSIAGSAVEKVVAANARPHDYEITSDYKEVTIEAGQTEGIIKITLASDLDLEEDETIELSIEDSDSEDIEITRDDDITITVTQEDGLIVALTWGDGNTPYTDVDMDLFLWLEDDAGELTITTLVGYSGTNYTNLRAGTQPLEYIFIPSVIDDGNLGISCTYYSGTASPMKFTVGYVPIVNGDDLDAIEKAGEYTLDNINKYDEDDAPLPVLIGTFKKAGASFTEFSDLTIPATSSRRPTQSIDVKNLRKPASGTLNARVQSFFRNK